MRLEMKKSTKGDFLFKGSLLHWWPVEVYVIKHLACMSNFCGYTSENLTGYRLKCEERADQALSPSRSSSLSALLKALRNTALGASSSAPDMTKGVVEQECYRRISLFFSYSFDSHPNFIFRQLS